MQKLAITLLSVASIVLLAAAIAFAVTGNWGAIVGCVVLLVIDIVGIRYLMSKRSGSMT
jgi:hypothetical protein